MGNALRWAARLAEGIAAFLLAAIFVVFLIQIGSRYFPRIISALDLASVWPWLGTIAPLGWTLELIAVLWIWVIFFACAFVVRERDHVRFDILYLAVPRPVRRIMALVSSLCIVAGMAYALLPTWDYIDWMKMRRTSTVENPFTGAKIPLRTVFSIYAVFMVAVALRYVWLFVRILRHGPPLTEIEAVVERSSEPEART